MNKNFKDSLKEHFADIQISDEKFKQLQELDNKASRFAKVRRNIVFASIAAMFLGAMIFTYQSQNKVILISDIASEIVYNHNKQMSPEIFTSDPAKIGAFLEKLDFHFVMPKLLLGKSWKVVGARYCSIGGKIAAQLRIMNTNSGKFYTLYEANLPDKLESKKVSESYEKAGSYVKVWDEKGLLMGLAGPSALTIVK